MSSGCSSVYTIDVGQRRSDGTRDVILLHDGSPFFTATHRDVQWAFLASFDSSNSSSVSAAGDQPSLASGEVGADELSGFQAAGATSLTTSTEEYLCVFHREELKDSNDRYVFAQPNTLCTSYRVRDGTSTHFVLHNITPSSITPGHRGVFISGSRQTSRWGHAPPMDVQGESHQPAADMWWMASPLVVKPVYVNVSHVEAHLFSSPVGSPMSTQLRSRSSSPIPGSPAYNLSRCAVIDAQVLRQISYSHEADRSVTVFRAGPEELGLALTKPLMHADVLTWSWTPHRVFLPNLAPSNSMLSITVSEHPLLSSTKQVIFLYDSQHMKVHIISTPNFRSVQEAAGEMQLLLTLPCGDSPTVLPCIRPSSPQPILVANYPADDQVTLFDPVSLLSWPSAENYIAVLPVSACAESKAQAAACAGAPCADDSCGSSQTSSPRISVLCPTGQQRRIDGIASQLGSTVVYNYSYQSRASSSSGRPPREEATSGGGGGGRRRCEISLQTAVSFPSFHSLNDPLLYMVLEALEASLGPRYAHCLEYQLIHVAWQAKSRSESCNMSAELCTLIVDCVRDSISDALLPRGSSSIRPPTATTAATASLQLPEMMCYGLFTDPSTVTAASVDVLVNALGKKRDGGAAPTSSQGRTVEVKWPLHVCGLCLVTFHMLYESCKLQERYWPLLDTLGGVVTALSSLLRWTRYSNAYPCMAPEQVSGGGEAANQTTVSFAETLSEDMLSQVFTLFDDTVASDNGAEEGRLHPYITTCDPSVHNDQDSERSAESFQRGYPPFIMQALETLLQRRGVATTAYSLPDTPRRALWPILRGLPLHHPISIANRVYQLYRDCFDPHFSLRHARLPWWQLVCHAMVRYKIPTHLVCQELAVGVAYPIQLALLRAKDAPEENWDDALYTVVGRLDRVLKPASLAVLSNVGSDVLRTAEDRAIGRQHRTAFEEDDGVLMRPDFPQTWKDSRLDVLQIYFNTTSPIALPNHGHPSDLLKGLSLRACALPIGRGMFTMSTHNFKVRDGIPIPRLNLDGRTSDGIVVSNNVKELQDANLMWPLFHNGCAAGARFLPLDTMHANSHASADGSLPKDSVVTRHWVVYQTQRTVQCPASRAGLLLAAGILGHLRVLQLTDIYSLLASPQLHYAWREATTMAVMLGLSCSFRGTNNDLVFRCLSMHVQSLTPSAEEIEVSLDVQTTALVSIGLLCQQTPTNGFLVEMLLIEMSRMPSDEHCMNREGYALGAGFSLGLILLGLGNTHGIAHVEHRLFNFMEGAKREAVPCAREGVDNFNEMNMDSGHFLTRALFLQAVKESSKCTCTRVHEGDYYNVAVSGPAAVVALGLMYLKTNNESVSRRLLPPNRYCGMQGLSPNLCLLRTMLASLVMWSSVSSTRESLYRFVPSILIDLLPNSGRKLGLAQQQVHYLLMNLGHCIAGAALALGLRYAGSMDADAREVILAELQGFLKGHIGSTGTPIPTLQRSTGAFESCISACCVAASLVTAGSGDMKTYALLQRAEKRPNTSYGVHMAISMSIGLLFLGGGRLTLSTSTPAVAALIISLYPRWPRETEDNVHHLQPLRHLYGLAVVPRVIETLDAISNRPVSVPIRVILRKGRGLPPEIGSSLKKNPSWTPVPTGKEEQEVHLQTPCLYPPPEMIERIEIRSTNHYPRVLHHQSICISEAGLSVKVLEKANVHLHDGASALVPYDNASIKNGTPFFFRQVEPRTACERRILHWLNRVFSQRTTSVRETYAILDSVKFLVSVQKRLLAEVVVDSEMIPSPEFGQAIQRTLEKRYQYIFMCGPAGSRHQHPLHALIIEQQPWAEVIRGILASPKGTPGFPCDFSSLATSTAELREEEIMRWMAESLHFYFNWTGSRVESLSSSLRGLARQLLDARSRMVALLQVNRCVLLPARTMEQLVTCCFDI